MRFTRIARSASNSSEQEIVSSLTRKLRVRYLLNRCPAATITVDEFVALCTKGTLTPQDDRMTPPEATLYLDALHDARVVLREGNTVFLRPADVLDKVHRAAGLPKLSLDLPSEAAQREAVQAELSIHKRNAVTAIERAALWRKRFWSGVIVGSGTQMSFLAYLTFVAYDWDVMEPACYFVTCSTSLLFYLYFLLFRREQSLRQVDENFLPVKLTQYFREEGVEVEAWMRNLKQLEALDAGQANVRSTDDATTWVRAHTSTIEKA